ncbi:MAG: tetratricopeptide repeat protein [Deltaproteobacteria bacterium]|nr:tetratricopeptide repeat protein [Deltaproteobacteria bacterium]MCW5803451.1 tetratricopeptide repeat protein [Deltaproteobacteria bacterium]
MSELRLAERRSDAGDVDGAVAAYRVAQGKCGQLRPRRRAKAACAEALLGEGEALERGNRTRAAIDVYLAIPPRVTDDATTSAIATYRAGELLLRVEDTTAAWTALWRVVTDWPDEGPAGDALRTLLADGRRRNARALADELQKILTSLADTDVADNIVWSLADLEEHELANPQAARAFYDRIPVDYPTSGLRDDARWHAARISRELGDPKGAVVRLRGLLATREVAFGAGSYFSIWLDDAQLELGKILRDDLDDLRGAITAFEQLPELYPASILRDDALYELAVTHEKAGHHDKACAALVRLAKLDAESKYIARGKDICPP